MAKATQAFLGLRVVIGVVISALSDVTMAQSPEPSNLSADRQDTVQQGASPFQSPGFVFLRDQLQHGDALLKERVDDRYQSVKEQLKEGDALLKEQLTEGLGRLKEQQREGDNQLKEQLTAEEDRLKSRLTREEDHTKEQLAKQQEVNDGLKQQLEQWMTKNGGAVELLRQEVSELKGQLEVTKTSLQDTRDTLTTTRTELEATTDNLHTTQQALKSTQDELRTALINTASTKTNTGIKRMERFETVHHFGGSTFVRWGRTTCGNVSDLVYTGVVGGSYFGHKGGSPTRLCMSLTPDPDPRGTAVPGDRDYLYGAEYDGLPNDVHQDVPCAVCLPRGSAATIMVPGTLACPVGWTAQYTGLLVSGKHDHERGADTVCLDGEYEYREGGSTNTNGDLFYLTGTSCGSLPCPPYKNAQLVTCAVCSLN